MEKLISKNNIIKNTKGITLVSLVITIIILLLLTGITISLLTGSGIFEKVGLAKEVNLQLSNNLSSNTKKYYEKTFSNVNVVKEIDTSLSTITLPAGVYVLVGFANYQGNDLRYHLSLGSGKNSAYDNWGYVRMNVTSIEKITEETTYEMSLFASKNITVTDGYIKAIKIDN